MIGGGTNDGGAGVGSGDGVTDGASGTGAGGSDTAEVVVVGWVVVAEAACDEVARAGVVTELVEPCGPASSVGRFGAMAPMRTSTANDTASRMQACLRFRSRAQSRCPRIKPITAVTTITSHISVRTPAIADI
ncbi:hypothetical protein [Nocardia bovistercoris]|uniref:hypothetical protein n=1 Tax=Nocardia bovistercoris TaxID=2785916 RepID=UPI001E3A8E89|nr:hypothetical protein [Nocardia bovistercoris]